MVNLTLKSGSTLQIKSFAIKGAIIDSNGKETGGNADFVFIESEVAKLESALSAMGLSIQAIYDAVYPPIPEETEE